MKTVQKLMMIFATALFFVAISCNVNAQSVGIGEREFTPHPSAILEIQSTTQGVLIPRVTFTQRMHIQTNAQAAGLLVFQVDREEVGFHYFDGLVWRFLEPNVTNELPNLATVAFTGNFDDLINRPNIADLPNLADVAFTGSWSDLENRPTIPGHLRDLEQDNVFYMTVNRQQIERWDASAQRTIPRHLRDLEQDNLFYMTVNREQVERWNAAAAGARFSGSWNDLTERPAFAMVAFSGDYNELLNRPHLFSGRWEDLQNRPTIPTHLSDLQQSEMHQTVSWLEKFTWNNKSDFSGRWQDLEGRPNFHNVATTGNFNDLQNIPIFPPAALSGRFEDLTGIPEWGSFADIQQLQIGTLNQPQFGGSMNRFARADHTHTIANSVPTQNVGTSNQTIVNTEMLHLTLTQGFVNQIPTETRSGDIISGGRTPAGNQYMLNIRPNVILEGNPRLEQRPEGRPNAATSNYIATTACLEQRVLDMRTELLAQLRAEIATSQEIAIPIGAVIMVTNANDRNRFLASACWEEVTEMRGRFPVGVGQCPQLGAAHVYTAGQTGGASQVTLTLSQIPEHTHSQTVTQWRNEGVRNIAGGNHFYEVITTQTGGITGRPYGATQPIENRPPFIGVYFFRRVGHNC